MGKSILIQHTCARRRLQPNEVSGTGTRQFRVDGRPTFAFHVNRDAANDKIEQGTPINDGHKILEPPPLVCIRGAALYKPPPSLLLCGHPFLLDLPHASRLHLWIAPKVKTEKGEVIAAWGSTCNSIGEGGAGEDVS